jgi:hypothetical protein
MGSITLVLSEQDANPLTPPQGCPPVADVVSDAVLTIYECDNERSELCSHFHIENTTLLMHPPCHPPLQHSKKWWYGS